MHKSNLTNIGRRDLLTKVMPVCAATFILSGKPFELLEIEKSESNQQNKSMFDKKMPKILTYKELRHEQYKNLIWLSNALINELGKEKALEVLKKEAENRNRIVSRRTFGNSKDRSLKAYTRQFTDPVKWENLAKIEVVEDTDSVFEMKVHTCIFAEVFRERNAGEIGYAYFCWGDYAHAEEFNPKVKMERDKTLMQGHDCCNHRYIWTG